MHATELSNDELRSIIADMREDAKTKRAQSRAMQAKGAGNTASRYMAEAIVTEHWANRLEALLP